MPEITLYRQERQDGGTRTAVMVNGANALHHFAKGKGPADPALLWFVDVRCRGSRLPTAPEEVRSWFLDNEASFVGALDALAEKLEAGLDVDVLPLQWEPPDPPKGTKVTLVCMAVRRVTALQMAEVVKRIRDRWGAILRSLKPATARAH